MLHRLRGIRHGCMLVGACMLLLFTCTCSKKETEEKPEPQVSEEADPYLIGRKVNTVLEHVDGRKIRFDEYLGRVVVVNFFATWHNRKNIEELIPIMAELQRKTKRRVDVIYVALDESAPAVKRFLQDTKIDYDVFINGKACAGAFGGVGKLPSTFIVYDDGRLIDRIEGFRSRRYYWGRVMRVLKRQ